MSSGGVVILFPRFPRPQALGARFRASVVEVLSEVVRLERMQARLAWSATLVGLVCGLALQSL